MKTLKLVTASALFVGLLVGAGCASEPSIRDASETVSMDTSISGTITAINAANRMITIRGEEGNEVEVRADDQVRNFAQLEVGDIVTLIYHRALAFDLQPAGSGEPGAYLDTGVAGADLGEKPAGVAAEKVTVLAPIIAIDLKAYTVTVKGPRGNVEVIHVQQPVYQKQLGKLKLGDMLRITYTEAVAVGVSKGP